VIAAVAILAEGLILSGRDTPPPPGSAPAILGQGQVSAHRWKTRSWSLEYDRAQMSPDGTLAEVDGIHNGILYRAGKPYLSITAQHISANTISDDFSAIGRVHVAQLRGESRTFDTDLITWTNASKTLTLAHPSIIKSGSATVTVDNATINFESGAVHLGKLRGAIHL
jgi:hypothetical protein